MTESSQKYRHEYKYVISAAEIPLLKNQVKAIMKPDPHAGADGTYNIRSLYFDDYNNSCYYENENGTDPREKFRIRIYNHSSDRITLECKRKESGKTLKTSCPLTYEQADRLIKGLPLEEKVESAVLQKFVLKMNNSLLHPVTIVEYDRVPYIYKTGNVRVTFDTNICASSKTEDFFKDVIPKKPIMPAGHHLMEVKFDEFLPDFIYQSLNLGHFRQTTFSKFYLCRKFTLI
ncbi:MAG: polyphosphate polymerase domain-containing protein [Clostridia bacterium]|nr:polyphosphate polymerase domain-containing protein [Clostridia bacterium]